MVGDGMLGRVKNEVNTIKSIKTKWLKSNRMAMF
jgi:hypothetical protein